MSSPDTRFARRARALYREAADHVDADTRARLRAARLRALAPTADRAPRVGSRWLLPGGAFAVVALAAVMLWQPMPHDALAPGSAISSNLAGADADGDLPPDAEQADPKLYENLDFYGWLAANNRPAGQR